MTDQELVKAVRNGNKRAEEIVYIILKDGFLKYCIIKTNREDGKEVFQDSVSIWFVNAKAGVPIKSIKGYMRGIVRFRLYDYYDKKKDKHKRIEAELLFQDSLNFKKQLSDLDKESFRKAFSELGDKCQKVITLFYHEALSLRKL